MVSSKFLVINPKPTATKLAVYQNNSMVFLKTIQYKESDLAPFKTVNDQKDFRKQAILDELKENDIQMDDMVLVMARGGLIKPMESGVYAVNERMREDLLKGVMGTHAVNLGGLIADEIAKSLPAAKAYIADPVVVDELTDIARVTGLPQLKRRSVFHALNQKVVARKYAKSLHVNYEDLNLIVVHAGGGGISIGAHRKAKVIDVNQAFDGMGPFAMERTGSLPTGELVRLCFSGKYTEKEVACLITARGGLKAYLDTSNVDEVEERIEGGDEKALFISEAMSYQIAKEVGAMYTVLEAEVDALIFSGHLFYYPRFTRSLSRRVEKLAPIAVYPDENYIEALAENAMMVLKNEVEPKEYT